MWLRPEADSNDIVECYHGAITAVDQERITTGFTCSDSRVRCVVCTEGFGFGINSKQVRKVILWGAPKDILTLWQEAGRCSRDGKQGEVVLYLFPFAMRNCDEHMKTFCTDIKSGKCIRKEILRHFQMEGMSDSEFELCNRGYCCSNCDNKPVSSRD